jgi:mRNA interferase HigB
VHIVSIKRLKEFWTKHRDAETPLRAWFRVARTARWKNLAQVRKVYPHADDVDGLTVFNIGGKKYPLIVKIQYKKGRIFVRQILTHSEYDKGGWKE